jgi:prephenate dehydratase
MLIIAPDVFDAVQSGAVTRGIVPFENSTNGSVVQTLDLFADRLRSYPDISVCGEAYLSIHHYLLGHNALDSTDIQGLNPSIDSAQQPRTRPLSDLGHIKNLYTHPQAFGQCECFLSAYLKGVERHEVSSTSKAAEIVSKDSSGTSAAIASKVASEMLKLDVLAEGIEDRDDNTTRFLVLRKGLPEETTNKTEPTSSKAKGTKHKTFVSFTVGHANPGALAEALAAFKPYHINFTSINSRPSRMLPWHYIFFVEFDGSKLNDEDGKVNAALKDLAKVAKEWRWLGSWRNRLEG